MMDYLVKVSIITVSLNAAGTIEQTILSVLNQTYTNIEYIIIDGNSDDGTKEIIEKYKTRLSYYISEPDNGIYYAMNKGISHANGEIIGIINCDDWYETNAVEKVVQHYIETKADVISGHINVYDEFGNCNAGKFYPIDNIWYLMPVPHPSTFVKRDIYNRYGGFDTRYRLAADYELLLRFYAKKAKFECINDIISNFRIGGASSAHSMKCAEESRSISLGYKYLWEKDYRYQIEKIYKEAQFHSLFNENPKLVYKVIRDNFIQTDRNIAIFGAGVWGMKIAKMISESGVGNYTVIDNNEEKWNTEDSGIIVRSPKILEVGDWNIIIAVSNFSKEIEHQLREYRNEKLRWLTLDELRNMIIG